ncbi:MAG: hypothetical protein D6798_07185, partial [Deltaproteobacteria bacterium]
MCGRFALAVNSADELIRFFARRLPPNTRLHPRAAAVEVSPRYNIAPGQQVPVMRVVDVDDARYAGLSACHWGLVPSWSKGEWPEVRRRSYRMINARAETVFDR